MGKLTCHCLILIALFITSCRPGQQKIEKRFSELGRNSEDKYPVVYAYASYLASVSRIEAEFAISLINDMLAWGYPTEARYAIDNLMRNGIGSPDLLALRGICYRQELQPGLALSDFEEAYRRDPDNPKIRSLLTEARMTGEGAPDPDALLEHGKTLFQSGNLPPAEEAFRKVLAADQLNHEALHYMGLIRLQREQYDSARYYMEFARSSEKLPLYDRYIEQLGLVLEGEEWIRSQPAGFRGYLRKSQGLAGLGLFSAAQEVLDRGLERNPDHVNLILAKALTWVQAGEKETAALYLEEQERRGIGFDPSVRKQVLQQEQQHGR